MIDPMANVELNCTEFYNVVELLKIEGVKFSYEVAKGMVVITIPYFFLEKYGF